MIDPIIFASAMELAKLGLQVYFAAARQANLTEEQLVELLDSERERFEKNISQPLTEV